MTFLSQRALILALVGLPIAALGCGEEQYPPPDPGIDLADVPPPPISGGTLAISRDQRFAFAADPDRDRAYIVNLSSGVLAREIIFQPGDEPGRVVEDGAGYVHVALRRGGAIVTMDPASGNIVRRTPVCPAPRGLAYDASADALHVGCVDGRLVTLSAATGAIERTLQLEPDLRDVVMTPRGLLVTHFRSAELLFVSAEGAISDRALPSAADIPGFDMNTGEPKTDHFEPDVAWRAVASPSGGVFMVHQRAMSSAVSTEIPGGYSSPGCGSIVHGTVSRFEFEHDASTLGRGTLSTSAGPTLPGILPVDIAVSGDGAQLAIAAAGSDLVVQLDAGDVEGVGEGSCDSAFAINSVAGNPIALAYAGSSLVVQTREPASLVLLGSSTNTIALSSLSRRDTGHEMFHRNDSGMLACASCHPEGREDGRVWHFDPLGPRRTQALGGGVLATAPLHWSGDIADIGEIMTEVFEKRMAGAPQGPHRVRALKRWLDADPLLPALRAQDDPAAQRGKALFENAAVGCAGCHEGERFTNDKNADIGKGEALQVPSLLGVGMRAPYMHDGCATTLADRFDPACGGDRHGNVAALTDDERGDLVAYLESL